MKGKEERKKKTMKEFSKKNMVKKVLTHIKEDDKDFRKQIKDDRNLEKTLRK